MPWRKRLQVVAGVMAFAGSLAIGMALLLAGRTAAGGVVVGVSLVLSILALQAYWVRFDLPWPLGSTGFSRDSPPESSPDSSGTGYRTASRKPAVALTFDDGPGPDTPAVLDKLDEAQVHATFFVLGTAARERPDLVREVARRGHAVASHGDTHRKLHLALPGTIAREIDRGLNAIRAAGVEPAPLFRAPHGFKGPLLARALRARGLTLVGWTRGVWDSEAPGTSVIVERACRNMSRGDGAILLLHDGIGTPRVACGREQTARAVPEIARRWREAGYEFVTVEQLTLGASTSPRGHSRELDAMSATTGRGSTPRSVGARTARRSPPRIVHTAGLIAIAVLAVLALRHLDVREIARALSSANLPFLLAAACANVLALAMQAGRWLAVVHPVEPRARPRDAFFSLVAGYAVGMVVPARASDLARAHLMSRRNGSSIATLTTTAVVDHLLGTVALLAALGIAANFGGVPAWIHGASRFALAIAVAGLVTLWFLRPRGAARTAPPTLVPGKSLGGFLFRLRLGLVAVGRPRALGLAFVFAIAGWAAEGLIAHLALRAFGLPSGVAPSMMAVVATTLSAAASVSPGNAGAFEVACVAVLSGFGVSHEAALAFAIGYHAVHLIPTAVIGGGWLLGNGYRPATLRGLT